MRRRFAKPGSAAWQSWRAGLCLLALAASLVTAQAQLAITEAMSSASSLSNGVPVVQGPDYWELTNFGNQRTNLTGWSWGDTGTSGLTEVFDALEIDPGESVVLYRSNHVFTIEDFRSWWGLPDTVQVRPWGASPGLSSGGGRVHISDPEGNLVQSVQMGPARPGVSFVYDTNSGVFGVFSAEGVGCAVRAATADDVGSPGCTAGPVPPSILKPPMDLEVDACQEATFSIQAGAVPALQYQWWFKSEFSEGPISGATSPAFSIVNTQPPDAGQYWVVLGNLVSAVTSQVATLTVSTNPRPPTIVEPPKDAQVFPGQSARFAVNARGYPCLSYQWRSNGVDLPGANGRTRTVSDVSLEQSGTLYSVVVSNALGTVTNAALLQVTTKPKLVITEVMSYCNTNTVIDHRDWFELTNYDTNSVNLQGWRIYDSLGLSLADAIVISQPVTIHPGESIVFVEQMAPQAFLAWWGGTNLPPGLQVVPYRGFGLSEWGEALYLWNPSAEDPLDFVTSVGWWQALPGISMYFFRSDPTMEPHDSVAGVDSAFAAVEGDDVGSPGFALGVNPRFLGIAWDASGVTILWQADPNPVFCLQFTPDLAEPAWQSLGTYSAAHGLISFRDRTDHASRQGFYRLQEGPCP